MAHSVRVHELAKELGLENDQMLKVLQDEGIEVTSHLSGVDEEMAELVREHVRESQKPVAEVVAEALLPDVEDVPEVILADDGVEDTMRSGPKRRPRVPRRARVAGAVPGPGPVREEEEPAPKPERRKRRRGGEVHVKPPIVVRDLADALEVKPNAVIQELLKMGVFASINQQIDIAVAEKVAKKHDKILVTDRRGKFESTEEEEQVAPEDVVYEDAETETRPPVVAFLGHVDHGKTSLQDKIRQTHVTDEEAGGITQHVGASVVEWRGHDITFIDTPGHEAFTAMRARGAETTDIVILVVAADDGFMPQTVEALNHARAAKVPLIVAINKIDLPGADPDKVLLQMQQNSLTSEDWGGDVGTVRTSAETGEGLDNLLERIVLESELLELKANPKLPGQAVVIESEIEQGLGSTANVLVKNGTLKVGDTILCGSEIGRVKALIDHRGKRVKTAGPSTPVKVVGLSGLAECGAKLVTVTDEKQAKRLADERGQQERRDELRPTPKATLQDLFSAMAEGEKKQLKIVLKADVQGTCEAVTDSLMKQESEKVVVDIIHSGVGAISENDVLLASASGAIVVGFHVRVNPGVNKMAREEGVEIRLYSVIYELIEQMREAMIGMLEPERREEVIGQAEILQIFEMSKGGKICGCMVQQGAVRVGAHARVFREGDMIYNGSIASLRRYQDDVKEVRQGLECGIRLDNFNDFEVGDRVEVYEYRESPGKL